MIIMKLQEKKEELLKTRQEIVGRLELLKKEFEQLTANANAVSGALILIEELEIDKPLKESKTK